MTTATITACPKCGGPRVRYTHSDGHPRLCCKPCTAARTVERNRRVRAERAAGLALGVADGRIRPAVHKRRKHDPQPEKKPAVKVDDHDDALGQRLPLLVATDAYLRAPSAKASGELVARCCPQRAGLVIGGTP